MQAAKPVYFQGSGNGSKWSSGQTTLAIVYLLLLSPDHEDIEIEQKDNGIIRGHAQDNDDASVGNNRRGGGPSSSAFRSSGGPSRGIDTAMHDASGSFDSSNFVDA